MVAMIMLLLDACASSRIFFVSMGDDVRPILIETKKKARGGMRLCSLPFHTDHRGP